MAKHKALDLSPDEEPLKTGAGLAGFPAVVTGSTRAAVNELTSTPPRVTAGYKIEADVKRRFVRFAKWYNRDRDPQEETEIGVLAQEALEDLMQKYGYPEAQP